MVGTATGLIDPANSPSAAEDGEVLPVLVDPGTEAGRVHGKWHSGSSRPEHLADRNKCLARKNKSLGGREASNASNGVTPS